MKDSPILWIVVPCYNEEAMLPLSMPRLEQLLRTMTEGGEVSVASRIVYVDDCSRDSTWAIIREAHARKALHSGLHLGLNAGQQNAMIAGLEASAGRADCVVTIDADLQDDISVIPDMVRHYCEGYDIVYGVRSDRSTDSWFKRSTGLGFYRLMGWLGARTVYNHSEFRLMSSRAIAQLSQYGERSIFLRSIVTQLGYPSTTVTYERQRREAGETKYSVGRLLALALTGITSVTVKPIRLISVFGLLFLLVAVGVGVWVVWSMVDGRNVPGWVSLMLSMWFIGGCLLAALGVIGEYIGNMYLDVKQRPRYNITEQLL